MDYPSELIEREMKIERVPINSLVFDPSNARLHDNKNLDAIKGSLKKFGQRTPIVIDEQNIVLKGNGTLASAKALGWQNIYAVRVSDLNEVQKAAYAIADNRSSELARWDDDVLTQTLLALRDQDFELDEIGFDDVDIKKILGDEISKESDEKQSNIQNQYGVIVICGDESEQETVFNTLTEEGYECKVVVT